MLGLHVAGVVNLAVYLVGITVIGIAAARLIHTMSDFFMPRHDGIITNQDRRFLVRCSGGVS